jgi:hypothetical protein
VPLVSPTLLLPRHTCFPERFQTGAGSGIALVMEASEEENRRPAPEDDPGEPGAEGGSGSDAADKPPAMPAQDDSEVGDTDQHSSA